MSSVPTRGWTCMRPAKMELARWRAANPASNTAKVAHCIAVWTFQAALLYKCSVRGGFCLAKANPDRISVPSPCIPTDSPRLTVRGAYSSTWPHARLTVRISQSYKLMIP